MEHAFKRANFSLPLLALALAAAVACALAPIPALIAIGALIALCCAAALVMNLRWAFLAFVFSLPFATVQVVPIPGLSNLAFLMVIVLALSMLANIRRLPSISLHGLGVKPYLFLAFLTVATIGLFTAGSQAKALKFYAIGWIIFGLYIAAVMLMPRKTALLEAANVFLAGCMVSGALIAGDFIAHPIAQAFYRAGAAFSGGINITICFLVALPLSLALLDGEKRLHMRAWYYAIALISGSVMLFSATRSAWLAMLLYFAYELFKRPLRAAVVAGLLALAIFVVMRVFMPSAYQEASLRALAAFIPDYQPQQYIGFRVENYGIGAKMFASHPLLGVGLGNFSENAASFGRSTIPVELGLDAHNTYLETIADAGLLGGLPYLLVWLLTLYELGLAAWRGNAAQRRLAVGLGIGFSMFMVHGMFHNVYLVLLLALLFASGSVLRRELAEDGAKRRAAVTA
jgi:O-antigen ligase